MSHTHWIYPMDLSGDEEAKQAYERQPHFMLQCSKIVGATFVREVTKKDIPGLTTEAFLYKFEGGEPLQTHLVLDRHCAYLLGVFNEKNERIFLPQFEAIKEKSQIFSKMEKEFKKIQSCVGNQQIVQSLLENDSNEYKISFELLSFFNQKSNEWKIKIDYLKKEIERMINEYVMMEIKTLHHSSKGTTGINIQGTVKHYLEYFLSK